MSELRSRIAWPTILATSWTTGAWSSRLTSAIVSAAWRWSSSAANAATMWSTSAVERYICSMNDVTVFSSVACHTKRIPVADSTFWRRHGDGSAA